MAYTGPSPLVDPAKTTPLATVMGPLAVELLGSGVDQRTLPVDAFMATQAPPVVTAVDGESVMFLRSLLAMLYLRPSVAEPQVPPPQKNNNNTVDHMISPVSRSRAQAKPLFWVATAISLAVPLTTAVTSNGASPKSASGLGPGGQLGVEGSLQA
ncbi:LOW QUALITY PROTEIN: hypothetical protein V2J09_024168 [Rumex salicifolius]